MKPSNAPTAAVASPCVSLCQMHESTGWCRGCLRTLDEIACWGGLDDADKRSVLHSLRARRQVWRALSPELRGSAQPAEGQKP